MNFGSIPFVAMATPASPPSGSVIWEGVASTSGNLNQGGSGVVLTKPSGTVSTDALVAVMTGVTTARAAQLEVPTGWTLRGSIHTTFSGNLGVLIYTAAGNVADNAWKISVFEFEMGYFDVHRVSGVDLAAPVDSLVTREDGAWGLWSLADMPTPSVTVSSGGAVISHYYQAQSSTAVGTPTSGYTRVVDSDAIARRSTVVQSNMSAGSTGEISHNANASWEARAGFTLALKPA